MCRCCRPNLSNTCSTLWGPTIKSPSRETSNFFILWQPSIVTMSWRPSRRYLNRIDCGRFFSLNKSRRAIPTSELRQVDPQLDSLRNLNTPEAYRAALKDAGLGGQLPG